jgi:ppGpp synthetase/RelA/SpoT-type nucleotidyltranferase
MKEIEDARRAWPAEKPEFEKFAAILLIRLKEAVLRLGIYADVYVRTKELDSLIKKLLLKPAYTYDALPDKVGARIIVKYRSDLKPIADTVSALFDHDPPDDKAKKRGNEGVGYLSIHLDRLRLKDNDNQASEFPPSKYFAEAQLRTHAQHLWAEMSHDAFYKSDKLVNALPADLVRRINLMAGQVEVADREFDRLNDEIPTEPAFQLLQALERKYFRLTTRRPNPELSIAVIKVLLPMFGNQEVSQIINRINQTFDQNSEMLEHIYQNVDKTDEASAFFFQPEALMIYDRLLNDRDETLRMWNKSYPSSELELVATNLGIALY